MQWLIAFIAAASAAAVDQNIAAWGTIGFLIGHVLNLSSRITQLERKLSYLHTELIRLTSQKPTEMQSQEPELQVDAVDSSQAAAKTVFSTTELKDETASFLVSNEYEDETESESEAEAEAEVNLWMSQNVVNSPEESHKSKYQPAEKITLPPSDVEKLFAFIWGWFTDGNTFVRIGIVILFIGVSFLLNLAIDRGYIPIELRLSAVAAGAIGLLVLGWKLRESRGGYALLLQGGAVGLLYLTIFASYNLYHVLPAALAFFLLVLIVGLSATLAVLENTVSMALFGSIGGFLAPILTSAGTNNYIGLFSFYALLNAGIFAIAWFKAWRILNLVGFTFTFSIGAFWGSSNYLPENFATVEPFLILFFLFYVGIAILYATRRAPDFKDYIDGTLNFGTPILAFGLQAAMLKNTEYGVAISAFVLGVFYLGLASFVWNRLGESLRFLSEVLLSICVIFLTLAVPFAMDGSNTSATWAVESTGVLWVSIRQQHFVRRVFALGLQVCAAIALSNDVPLTQTGVAFFNSTFIGIVLLSFCGGLSSWMLSWDFPTRRDIEKTLSPLLLAYGLFTLFLGFNLQIQQHGLRAEQNDLMLSLTIVMTFFLMQIGRGLNWTDAKNAALSMIIPLILGAFVMLAKGSHPSAEHGLWLWSLAFMVYFYCLKQANTLSETGSLSLHVFTGIYLAILLFWEGFWQLLLVSTFLSLLFNDFAKRFQWSELKTLAFGLFPVMLFLTLSSLITPALHPFELPDNKMGFSWSFEPGYALWPFAFAVLYWLFYDNENQELEYLPGFRGLSLLLLVSLCTWESSWHLSNYFTLNNGWHIALFPLFALAALGLMLPAKIFPFKNYQEDYLDWTAQPLILGLMLWSMLALVTSASSAPLPWLPLLNPAELMQAMVLLMLLRFTFLLPEQRMSAEQKQARYKHLAYFCFVWLNFMLLRAIHHWGGLPWSPSLLDKAVTQTCLSIFWTLCGLSLTIMATKKQVRKLWISGAVLLTIVVIKLFLFDLHSHDSMERIISFITVGGLLMLIGYFAPLPPKQQERENVE